MGNAIMFALFVGFSVMAAATGVGLVSDGRGPFTVAFGTMVVWAIPAFIVLCFVLDYADKHERVRDALVAVLTLGAVVSLIFAPLSPRPDQFFGFGVVGLLLPIPVFCLLGYIFDWEEKRPRQPGQSRTEGAS